jgi:sodium transport system permease protein
MISVIGIPTLVMPLLFFGMGKVMSRVFAKAEAEVPAIMVVGGDDSPGLLAALKAARNTEQDRPLARFVPAGDFKQDITNKRIAVAVEIPVGFDAGLQAGEFRTINLDYFEGDLKSGVAVRALETFLNDYRQKFVEQNLRERGLPASLIKPYETKRHNVAPQLQVDGNKFGGLIPYIIIILCFTGAMYPAMDTTAGEKERGTMETLLCSPVSRLNIVLGKFLLVLTGSLTAIVCSLTSMIVMAMVGGSFMGSGARAARNVQVNLIPSIDPMGLIGVLAMVVPVAILFAAIALTISLFAKSFKEAQSYLSPMIFVVIMPAMIGMLPGVELSAKTALIPILNLSLVCKEMLSGVWHWNYIALIFGSTAVYAAIAVALCVRMFNREDVIFRA